MIDVKKGTKCKVRWEENPATKGKKYPKVRSNYINDEYSARYIVPTDDSGITPGEVWHCEIVTVKEPTAKTEGFILVKPIAKSAELALPDWVYIDPKTKQVLEVLLNDPAANILLSGDQGCGKTTIVMEMAKALGWEFRVVVGGAITDVYEMRGRFLPERAANAIRKKQAEDDGNKMLAALWAIAEAVASSIKIGWEDSDFVRFLREAIANPNKKYLIFIDEYTRIEAVARGTLLNVLDGTKPFLTLPTKERLEIPKNVRFVAAANEGEAFTLSGQDAADRSRWNIVRIGYMPADKEIALCLKRFPNCPENLLIMAIGIVNELRKPETKRKLYIGKSPDTRATQNIARLLACGSIKLRTALLHSVANQFDQAPIDNGRPFDSNTTEGERVAAFVLQQLVKLKAEDL